MSKNDVLLARSRDDERRKAAAERIRKRRPDPSRLSYSETEVPSEYNSFLDFALGVFGVLGLIVCLIRKQDGSEINFVAFTVGFLVSAAIGAVAVCAAIPPA